MLEIVHDLAGTHYDAEAYLEQFARDYEGAKLLWKFERLQNFSEPDVPSWVAWERGDVDESMRLLAEMREQIFAEYAARTTQVRRIRVVEEPLTNYLQWELRVLKVRAQAGDEIVCLSADAIRDREKGRLLPEVVGLDEEVMYQVLYNHDGELSGAVRISDVDAVELSHRDFDQLFQQGPPDGATCSRNPTS